MMTILRARDIASQPQERSDADLTAAFEALHASADKNKDRIRAATDRQLAQAIRDHVGKTEAAPDA